MPEDSCPTRPRGPEPVVLSCDGCPARHGEACEGCVVALLWPGEERAGEGHRRRPPGRPRRPR